MHNVDDVSAAAVCAEAVDVVVAASFSAVSDDAVATAAAADNSLEFPSPTDDDEVPAIFVLRTCKSIVGLAAGVENLIRNSRKGRYFFCLKTKR